MGDLSEASEARRWAVQESPPSKLRVVPTRLRGDGRPTSREEEIPVFCRLGMDCLRGKGAALVGESKKPLCVKCRHEDIHELPVLSRRLRGPNLSRRGVPAIELV